MTEVVVQNGEELEIPHDIGLHKKVEAVQGHAFFQKKYRLH